MKQIRDALEFVTEAPAEGAPHSSVCGPLNQNAVPNWKLRIVIRNRFKTLWELLNNIANPKRLGRAAGHEFESSVFNAAFLPPSPKLLTILSAALLWTEHRWY